MADLARHRIHTRRAIAEGEAGRDELFRKLLAMPADERAKVPPTLYARLTEVQLRALLGSPAAEATFASANPTAPSRRRTGRIRWWRRPLPRPPLRTALAAALAVGLFGGGTALAVITVGPMWPSTVVRSVNANTWPACPRLDRDTDGCVYVVENAITIPQAASALGMTTVSLQAVNPNLPTNAILPTGTRIIVWRARGTLYQ